MVAPATLPVVSVPRLWPGSTIVCLGTGPSLTLEDVQYCRGRARVIAIKHAIELAPWADVLYSCGVDAGQWWQRNGNRINEFAGLRYTLDPKAAPWATVLRQTGVAGIETDPSGLRTGRNSGYQAINLAVHLGAARIALLGYDMAVDAQGQHHYFGTHWHGARPPFEAFRQYFETVIEPLRQIGIAIVNASRSTTLTAIPKLSLEEALA